MSSRETVVAQVRDECDEDYVGMWEIHRLLAEAETSAPDQAGILEVVDRLLAEGEVTIGQFSDGAFHEWPGDRAARVQRLQRELSELGRAPDIGDIAWLAKR